MNIPTVIKSALGDGITHAIVDALGPARDGYTVQASITTHERRL